MKTGDRKRKFVFVKDTMLYALISSSALFLILIIFFRDSVDLWIALLFSGGIFVCLLFTTLGEIIVHGSDFRQSPDCCFSILQKTMDRGRAAEAEILELSYYMFERKLKDDDKLFIKLMLRILEGEKAPYDIPIEADIPKDVVSGMKQGDIIPVLIDRLDPKKVQINHEMLSKEPNPEPPIV